MRSLVDLCWISVDSLLILYQMYLRDLYQISLGALLDLCWISPASLLDIYWISVGLSIQFVLNLYWIALDLD